ncbi:MAG: phage virion morphogenesis protein [Ramlibacter sp.]|nr:phage virion morphogenesis protein [Ramlibacter sp.]
MIDARLAYKPVIQALREAAGAMANRRPLMRAVAGIMLSAVEDNFEQEGRPKWKDLAPSTKLSRFKEGKWPGKILQRSGALASSITQSFTADVAKVATNMPYARIQNFGGRTKPHVIKPKTKRALAFGGIVVRQVNHPGSVIPARPYMRLTPRDLRDVIETAQTLQLRAVLAADRRAAAG